MRDVRRGLRGTLLILGFGILAATAQATDDPETVALRAELKAKAEAYRWTPPADQPFDASEWETNDSYEPIGDPAAMKGGQITQGWAQYPPNLLTDGPQTNLVQQRNIHDLVFQPLLGMHPDTLNTLPKLAGWWKRKLSEDGKTEIYWFRLDPDARFSDGHEVTADDVIATWEHLTNPDRKDPSNELVFKQFEKPVALDKYTVRVQTKALNWRLFLYFSGTRIFPARYIRCTGEEFRKAYGWHMMPGSGPYKLAKREDMVDQESFTLTRRTDWWGLKKKWAVGLYNFDRVKWSVVRNRTMMFQKVQVGELDYYVIGKAQRWVEECEFKEQQMGWVQKRKVWTEAPQGFSGICFNMRKPPFDDVKVRKAFSYLFNREKLIDKLFFNEYEILDSYWPGSVWGTKDNPKLRYNPRLAAQLLAEAGYKTRNNDGWLVKDGKPFQIELKYGFEGWTRIWTVIREDYKDAGIDLQLKLVDFRVLYKEIQERKFHIHFQSWGAITYPNPRTAWSSELAQKKFNNNVPGFANERVDGLLLRYDKLLGTDAKTWARRRKIIQRIDKLIFAEHPYALGWYAPHSRVLFTNKFGYPKTIFTRTGDQDDVTSLWWVDPAKEAALKAAIKNKTKLPIGQTNHKPWAKKDQ